MSIRKINKKRLARKFRAKHAPLKVLPLTTRGGKRHFLKTGHENLAHQAKQSHPSSIQCSIERAAPTNVRHGIKQGRRKAPLTFHPVVSARFKMNSLRWIFLSIIIVFGVGVLFIMLQDGFGSMKNIVIYGAMGFFTFFMGYFGTIFAKDLLDRIMEKKDSCNEADIEA